MRYNKYIAITVLLLCFCGFTNFDCWDRAGRDFQFAVIVTDENGRDLLNADNAGYLLGEGAKVYVKSGERTLAMWDDFSQRCYCDLDYEKNVPPCVMYLNNEEEYNCIVFCFDQNDYPVIKDASIELLWSDGTKDAVSVNATSTMELFSYDIKLNGQPTSIPVKILK